MAEHGIDDELRQVEAAEWISALTELRDQGCTFLDHMVGIDELGRSDELRVVARLVDFSRQPPRGVQLHVRLPRTDPVLPSCRQVFATPQGSSRPGASGAGWHEREVHDFFGVRFEGGDDAPLLNHAPATQPWLRKDQVLAARSAQAWPGAKEPGDAAPSRRRMAPPGVPDPEVWGDRDPTSPPPSAEELAAAVAGGRVRRRR